MRRRARVLDHQREHRAGLRPEDGGTPGRPLDALTGAEPRGLAVDAEEAFALEAVDVDGVFGRVLVNRAVRVKSEQRRQQFWAAQQYLPLHAVAPRPGQRERVCMRHQLGRNSRHP